MASGFLEEEEPSDLHLHHLSPYLGGGEKNHNQVPVVKYSPTRFEKGIEILCSAGQIDYAASKQQSYFASRHLCYSGSSG